MHYPEKIWLEKLHTWINLYTFAAEFKKGTGYEYKN